MRLKIGSQCLYFVRDARTNQSRHWIPVTNTSGFGTAQTAGVRIRNMSINTTSRRTVPKEVVVVGAGPSGIVTALLLASQGHKVTVLERKREYGAGPGSIQIPVNGSSLLVKWGFEEAFRTVGEQEEAHAHATLRQPRNAVHHCGPSRAPRMFRWLQIDLVHD